MYLMDGIVALEDRLHPMAGVFPMRARMQPKLVAIRYVEVEGADDVSWRRRGERARGHEFRYSRMEEMPANVARHYQLHSKNGTRGESFAFGSVLGSYVHLHFASCPEFAERFVAACADRQRAQERFQHNEL